MYLSMMAIPLITSIILQINLPRVPSIEKSDNLFVKLFSIVAFLMVIRPLFAWQLEFDDIGENLLTSVIHVCIVQLYPTIYFLNHPNLKQFAWKTLQEWSQSRIVKALTPDLVLWKNMLMLVVFLLTMGGCFGFLFEYKWPKATNPNSNNRVAPV